MMDKEKEQKSTDTEEYEYGNMDLEFEEEDEDEDEYDGIYTQLEEQKIDNADKEDFEQVEELKPLCVSTWVHPKNGETMHGLEVVTRKDDAQVDFDDFTNLCIAAHSNPDPPNVPKRIPKRTDEPDVCSICYGAWTSHGNHRVCSLPCGHVYGMSCIKRWFQTSSYRTCPQCNKEYKLEDVSPIYETRICNLAADQKAPMRRFSFSRLGLIAFTKYEFARRNYAWDKLCDALKRRADVVGQQNDAMKRRSELLDRMANVLKRAKALEHLDNALRRANALRLRADALGRRADEYLQSAITFGLRAKALLERVRAFSLQVDAYKPRLKYFIKSLKEFYDLA